MNMEKLSHANNNIHASKPNPKQLPQACAFCQPRSGNHLKKLSMYEFVCGMKQLHDNYVFRMFSDRDNNHKKTVG